MKTATLISALLTLTLTASCDRPCAACEHGATATAALSPASAVHPMFSGCQSACGSKSHEDAARARVQPVPLGELTFCPVSGAVFRPGAEHPKREVNGKTLYFCCESCAGWFDGHRDEVLARRGL